ncbi:MAG TPA: RNA polymerase sigma factor, partial [Solirubrobacteraceae bacterium]|nr:RNA polymerase sigma factor [Solirubrobacteraceae bacterium]
MAEKVSSAQTDRRFTTGSRALPVIPRRLLSDERLLASVRGGDSGAFEALYDRHAAALLSFCFFILGSREDAEDAVQSTFAAAYRALLRDEREIEARPWLYAIARNACFGILRKRRPRDGEQIARVAGEDMFAQVEQRESVRSLLAAMLELPERHRTALILAELHGHSQQEIGRVLDVSPSTVKSYIFQARATLASERTAREVDCSEIRAELTSARGAALLRGRLRRHLRSCEGCSAYAAQISRRRRELGALLPLLPSLALRRRVLDATAGKAGGAGALGSAGAGVGAGGATLTGGIELGGVGAKALLAKALVLATGLGASAGAGTLVLSVASSQTAVHGALLLPSATAVAWREPGTSLVDAGSAVPSASPATGEPAAAVVSQSTGTGQGGAGEPPRAKQATHG